MHPIHNSFLYDYNCSIVFRQLVSLKLKNEQLLSIPLFILCDGLKNNTILLGADINEGWHSRYWGEYKGRNIVKNNELSVQSMVETHKKFPHASSMMVNKFVFSCLILFNDSNYLYYYLVRV